MNSGGSIDLNRIKIDPRTGEKFSFNLDIVVATAWYGQEATEPRIEPRTGEKFSFNVDIKTVLGAKRISVGGVFGGKRNLVESFGKNVMFDEILSVCVREMSRRNSGDGR